jgi:hypothetical protein
MLRAMWRELETGPRITLAGHEAGNPGYIQGSVLMGCRASYRPYQDKAVAFLLMIALYSYVLVFWRYKDRDHCHANNMAHASIISDTRRETKYILINNMLLSIAAC